jgi:hypothetical protein
MYKHKHIVLICLLFASMVEAQTSRVYKLLDREEAGKMFQKINKWYTTTPSYSFDIIHATYAGYQSQVPYERKKGYFKKYSTGFHSYIADIETIQNKSYKLTIDSTKKIMLVSNPVKSAGNSNTFDINEYQEALKKCTSIKIAEGKTKIIRMEFDAQYTVAAYEIYLNEDELFQSILVFYNREVKLKTGQMVKPKMGIVFENYTTKISPEKDELNDNKFFLANNTQVLELNKTYKNYTLLDQRIKNITK